MLTRQIIDRRRKLTEKLNMNTISLEEAKELGEILHQELCEANSRNDLSAACAISFLGLAVSAVIVALEK